MTECLIHVGMHKTGSTSIQESLKGFSDERFLYASLGRDANHSLQIFSLCVARPEEHRLHQRAGRDADAVREYVAQVRRDLARSLEAAGDRTLILSGEAISMIPLPGLIQLRDALGAPGTRCTIAGYVRPPAEFMTSAFQERVKDGAPFEFADLEFRNYRRTFAKFDEVFGRENVSLRPFDPRRFPGGCVVRDFCAWFGIPLAPERALRLNDSLSREAVSLLYTYLRFGPGDAVRGGRNALIRALAPLGRTKFRLSPQLVGPVLERNRADTEWIEARLGEPLGGPPGGPRPDDVSSESDLLTPDPALSRRLIELLGAQAPAGATGETPEEVALLVQCLHESLRRARPAPSLAARSAQSGALNADRDPTREPAMASARVRHAPGFLERIRRAGARVPEKLFRGRFFR